MPSKISDRQYGQAVLNSVQSGIYPESEEIVAAEVSPSALPTILRLVDQAGEDVKKTIREISKESASDIDGWISQAKQLRDNIKDTQKSARAISDQAQHGEVLQGQVNDAAGKVDLLKQELVFNETLARTLEVIRGLQQTSSLVENAVQNNDLLIAEGLLEGAEDELAKVLASQNPKIAGVIQAKIADLRCTVVDSLTDCWKALVHVDLIDKAISIEDRIQRGSTPVDLNTIIRGLSKVGLLEEKISILCKDLNTVILTPRLKSQLGATVYSLNVEKNAIRISGQLDDLGIERLFADMNSVVSFLCTRLPSSISIPLAALLMPNLAHRLISNWLSLELPMDVDGIQSFRGVLDLVIQFCRVLDTFAWPGKESLVKWTDGIPEVWLNKRREISLDRVRKLLVRGLGSAEVVERVETEMLSHEAGVFAGNSGEDEWNAEWSDEEGNRLGENPQQSSARENQPQGEGDDDVSAWGLDEDPDEGLPKDKLEHSNVADEGAEAWGWGDENDDGETSRPAEAKIVAPKRTVNGHSDAPQKSAREVTLKETYNITSLPKEILDIITQLISDAEILRKPEHSKSPIASAAGGLFSLPGLVLSMYRASAPAYYSVDPSGNMFLYNDCLWLAERLRLLTGTQFKGSGQINVGAAETEISALESFAKRTYGKEMEIQRTVIGDLLDGAQGFASCTEVPFSQECDIAVSSVVDRLRELHRQWKAVLSHSALLQSLGSLLSTVVNKIIVDVEDMSDISEPESQRLTTFCSRIAVLEDLFIPQQSPTASGAEQTALPLTAVYTPNWLKFQYLANILESSLVDIKYLWAEGELRLEFEAEELVDLIEALFADSEHRRKAIGEIRRASIRR
ncbi:hypothetical protein MMC07_004606 [Pseudocyphellaria aurata]|nr:hypothetical protein [Pseudocyphellaria aurata]